jgi:transposase InsO family protein
MNQTLARERAYARPYASEEERAEALSSFVDYYNWDRPHSACGGLPPMSRVNNVLAINN